MEPLRKSTFLALTAVAPAPAAGRIALLDEGSPCIVAQVRGGEAAVLEDVDRTTITAPSLKTRGGSSIVPVIIVASATSVGPAFISRI